jgi:hypothetical protein
MRSLSRFKTIDCSTHLADTMLKKYINKNKYLNRLADIDHAIGGSRAEAFLTVHDPVGTSNLGARADPSVDF